MKDKAVTNCVAEKSPVRVGDLVTVGLGPRSFRGMIVEDRGPIGVHGRTLYRIDVDIDDEGTGLELPEESFGDRTSLDSERYVAELCEGIIAAAKRRNAEIIVSFAGRGDVQVRGRSALPNIAARAQLVEEIHDLLVEEANTANGRIVFSQTNPPGVQARQTRFVVRPLQTGFNR